MKSKIKTILKDYFDRLEDKVNEFFPKGKCKERGGALMLNVYANMFTKTALKEFIEEMLTELHRIRANIPLTDGRNSREQVAKLIIKLEKEKERK